MSTEIALADKVEHAKLLATSTMLPDHLQGSPANLLWTMEMAEGLDLTLAQAVNGVVVIKSTPSLKAETMRALVLRAGHRFRVDTQTDTECVVSVARKEYPDDVQQFTYDMADAKRAGLSGGNWQKHPKAMLLARATSSACRAVFPDVIQGFYVPEEVAEFGHTAQPVTPPPVPKAKRATATREPEPVDEAPQHVDIDTGEILDAELVDEPPAEPKASKAQLGKIGAQCSTLGYTDRADRLALVVGIIGRPVESATELTMREASAVIERLDGLTAEEADLIAAGQEVLA